MMRTLRTILVVCLLMSLFWPTPGKAASNVPSMSARQLMTLIEESKGKVVMINFFASWCPPCKEEIPGLISLKKRYRDDQVVFIGLSLDHELEELDTFLSGQPFNYDIFIADADLAYLYGVRSIPHNAIHNKKGELVANQPGFIEERELRRVLDMLVRAK